VDGDGQWLMSHVATSQNLANFNFKKKEKEKKPCWRIDK
jgi:hypothetical protein